MKRVAVTGMSGISSLGMGWQETKDTLANHRSGVSYMNDWDIYDDLKSRLGAPAVDFELPEHYTRKIRRSMGRVSKMATLISELALKDAGLLNHEILTSGEAGIAYGSATGSPPATADFAEMLLHQSMNKIKANSYIQMMPHTTSINIALFLGLIGRVIPTSSACTSGSLAIGYSYETIQMGKQKVMIAGGAEELCVTETAVFDTLYAASVLNDTPELTPRPFDISRDGLVIGEGAGTLILEDYEFAKERGAKIYAEVVGFGTNTDGKHVTQPTKETMKVAMELALKDAGLSPQDIDYINGHGTATQLGDISESHATHELFGPNTPFSTYKGHMGHTLGACGSLEAWMMLKSMEDNRFSPTLHLENIDEKCADLDFIMHEDHVIDAEYVMSNNFAFGGMNSSLIFRRVS
jgi:3-oxoacyl-[acyl-carrier-protein] synthase II